MGRDRLYAAFFDELEKISASRAKRRAMPTARVPSGRATRGGISNVGRLRTGRTRVRHKRPVVAAKKLHAGKSTASSIYDSRGADVRLPKQSANYGAA